MTTYSLRRLAFSLTTASAAPLLLGALGCSGHGAAGGINDGGNVDAPVAPDSSASADAAAGDSSTSGDDGGTGTPTIDGSIGPSTDGSTGTDSGPTVDAGPPLAATITVDRSTTLGTIGPNFVGLSYEKSHLRDNYFRPDNAALVAMVDLLGPSILRVGGNSVDTTVWETYDAGPITDGGAAPPTITEANVAALAGFAKAANWTVLYGVNMKLSTPALAATEAAYASGQLGSSLSSFEIGNENDLYKSIAAVPDGGWDLSIFTDEWKSFRSSMQTAAPDASFTGPASATHYADWTVPFGADAGSGDITTLTQHYYVANGQSDASTIDLLLSPNPTLDTELAALNTAATADNFANRYRLSECNSFYNGGAPGVSDGYGTALWAIDFLFANAEHGSTGTNFHGGGDGTGYTPIADSDGGVVGARPVFYGMLMFTKAGQGNVLATSGAPTSIRFSAYAVAPSGGGTNVILSNKDPSKTVEATVSVGTAITSATALRLTGPSLDATSGVMLGGVAIGSDGTFTPNAPETVPTSGMTFTVSVPPASAVLVTAQ